MFRTLWPTFRLRDLRLRGRSECGMQQREFDRFLPVYE